MRSVLIVLLFLVSNAVHAAPPSDASIDDLLIAMKAEKTIDTMLVGIEQTMHQGMVAAMQGQTISAEQQRILDATPPRFAQILRDEMSWDKMHPLYVQIYRESFTQEEIDGLVGFYRSPAGIAYVDKMPLVMQKSSALMMTRMGPMMERMKAAMQQAVAEAKAAR